MKYESKKLKSSIRVALAAAVTALPMTAFAAESGEIATYDLDTVEVVGQRPVSQPVETVEEPAEETPNVYAGGQIGRESSLGVLGKRDFMDVPFNVTSFSNQLIENQQASSVVDVIVNDPSVSNLTLSSVSQAWMIRGFKAQQQDTQINGLYGVAPRFYGGIEYVDHVEVLKGPGALLGGMAPNGSVGGTINFITKRAEKEPKTSVTMSYGAKSQFTQHIDIGRRSDDGKLGVRVNLYNNKGGTAYQQERVNTHAGYIGLDYTTDRSRTTFDAGIISNRVDNAQYRLRFTDDAIKKLTSPPHVDINSKFGAPGTFRQITEKFGVLRSEYDLDKNLMVYGALGMRITHQDTLNNFFDMNKLNGQSDVSYRYNNQINKAYSGEIGFKGKVDTKGVDHELNVSANYMHYKRYMYQNQFPKKIAGKTVNEKTYTTSIYAPEWKDVGSYLGPLVKRTPLNDTKTLRSIAVSDIMTTNDGRWTFVLGGRYQQIVVNDIKKNTTYEKAKFSPAYALIHKMNDKVSLYANYIQGLNQGEEVTDTKAPNYGEQLDPYVAKQYEFGAKFDLGKIATTISAFSITNPGKITDPKTKIVSAGGEVRNRGLEWNFFGEPKKGTRLTGGMMWMDARHEKTAGGKNDGNRKEGIPNFAAVLGVEQDIHGVDGLTLTARMTYNSSAFVNQANTIRVSPWTRWDLGARYRFNVSDTPVTVRADVYNLFNRNYWRALDENAAFLEAGRTFMLSVTADF